MTEQKCPRCKGDRVVRKFPRTKLRETWAWFVSAIINSSYEWWMICPACGGSGRLRCANRVEEFFEPLTDVEREGIKAEEVRLIQEVSNERES